MGQGSAYEELRSRLERAVEEAQTNPKRLSLDIRAQHGTSETLVRDILKARTTNPTLETIELIAAQLKKPVSYFFGHDEPEDVPEPVDPKAYIPSVSILGEVLEGLIEDHFPAVVIQPESLRSAAVTLRVFLEHFAENPTGFAEPGQSRRETASITKLSHLLRATG